MDIIIDAMHLSCGCNHQDQATVHPTFPHSHLQPLPRAASFNPTFGQLKKAQR